MFRRENRQLRKSDTIHVCVLRFPIYTIVLGLSVSRRIERKKKTSTAKKGGYLLGKDQTNSSTSHRGAPSKFRFEQTLE